MPAPRLNAAFTKPKTSAALATKAVIKFRKITAHARIIT